ncbi:MAG: M23 family metallopeptidase [Ignavibacteria bacterium]|nr:M23 family metallopeptidase [Ignavibacteria bacterium]
MGKFRLYYFSSRSLTFVEARWFKTKFALLAALLGMVMLVVGFEVNQLYEDPLGLGIHRNRALVAENTVLKNQLKVFSSRLQTLYSRLTALSDRTNELRLLVDLPKIDEDTRKAGYGGTDDRVDFGTAAGVNSMLNDLRSTITKAERELQLQQASYRETIEKYEHNKDLYRCLPAIKPMEGFYSMHDFGMRLHPVFGVRRPHEGIDISNDIGTPVYATGDGVVASAGRTEAGYGIMILVNHGFGYASVYAHLSKPLVAAGQRVKRGDLIALSGRTGIVTGPHLHYEVRLNGVLQNPVDYFFDDIDYQSIKDQLAGRQ